MEQTNMPWQVFICIILLAFINWASKHPVLRKYFAHSGFDSFLQVGYQVVGKASETVQRGGEEIFNFWNPQAQDAGFGVVSLNDSQRTTASPAVVGASTTSTNQTPPLTGKLHCDFFTYCH
eukprot:Protomagalhaensia_sp_Gyna_25__1525@NODE_1784_length_1540_cov_35_726849_g1463_i0_p2_GENE_NODE_1784_length_1540_cov_35_726849_g1463_i0NODE_1784_length_1540_cov_35_726849_g1463_i0_p2_ORF_typecomplete_len135_score14_91_NODE_1784_length_1540_cov_35_726849_g1463_i011341496